MRKLSFFLVMAYITFFSASAAAQSRDLITHVSQVRVESRNNLIRLTWKDSPDAQGPVYIYRSARPFSGAIPANIRPVVVRYGAQYYIDDIEDMENVYYFIAASDIDEKPYETILPFVNSISTAQPDIPPVLNAELLQGISNLRTRLDGNRVNISFTMSDTQRNAVLYRSMQPVREPHDLLGAVMVKSGINTQYTDLPLSGSAWYYAVIYEDEISSGNIVIKPGINTTTIPVIIESGRNTENFMRNMPLPILTIGSEMPGGFLSDVTNDVPLSTASINMLKGNPMPSKLPLEIKRPRVYAVDLEAPAGGEDSALFQIVKDYFIKLEWESACINLQNYLSLPRSRDVEARARFYLGQTLYYTGNYKDALWEFLVFKSFSSVEAVGWIEAVLTAMVY